MKSAMEVNLIPIEWGVNWIDEDFARGGKIQAKVQTHVSKRIGQENPMSLFYPKGKWYNIDSSKILDSHFGIVPAVLSVELMRRWGQYEVSTLHNMKRSFFKPIKQGTTVTIDTTERNIFLRNDQGDIYAQFESSQTFPDFQYTIPKETRDIKNHIAELWVPHGKDFRFADIVWVSQDLLIGTYTLTTTYSNWVENLIPFWLIEESCAQIMLGALRSKNGSESPYQTYAQSETRGSENFNTLLKELKPGARITCVGKDFPVENDPKNRKVQFQYSCYINDTLFFRWNIEGNNIPKKVWMGQFWK